MTQNSDQRSIQQSLNKCMRSDYFRLSKRLHQLQQKPDEAKLARLKSDIEFSLLKREQRQESIPELNYPEQLPVSEKHNEIAEIIQKNQIVLLCGETGSGKTTQLPKICLQAGRGRDGIIGHTQPRRLAARAVSNRIAEELKTSLGDLVGFHTRFNQKLSERNLIKIMTDGILLAEIQHDRWLSKYDTIIIDEAHERSLNIDFLLGYLKQLLKKRKDLKLIITSATIDAERIAKHFDHAPIIEVSGKTYPVDIQYHPVPIDAESQTIYQQIDSAIDELSRGMRGDILVFLPGEREIHEASRSLKHRRERMDILPLYARLPSKEQQQIFRRGGKLRVILSTNVAETSLTIPGIRYVIDTGIARISRYSWRTKIQTLSTEKTSQASANQRAGRCGREAPGICIRLYDEEDFNHRPEFTDPEILRTNLASVILQMASLKLSTIDQFPFIDAPDGRLIRDGYRLLEELQAIDKRKNLTEMGRQIAKLPIDPRFGRMIVAANKLGVLNEILIITTALTVRDPRERPHDKQQAADLKHEPFVNPASDFLTLVNLWNYLEENHQELSQSKLRKLCLKTYLNYRRFREWRDTHRQLVLACKELKFKPAKANQSKEKYDLVHQALLHGLLDHIALKDEKQLYLGCRNQKLFIFPGSGLGTKTPKWLMAAEISATTKLYARTVGGIQPQWVEHIGAHLLKHSYSEPHWQKRAARVGGFERLSLYGLIINPKRKINYASVDPVIAREIFIRFALVYGEWDCKIPVIKNNRKSIEDIEKIENRLRQRDLLINDDDLFNFYDQKLPNNIHSGAAFNKWFKTLDDPSVLHLSSESLLQNQQPEDALVNAFPLTWDQNGMRLPLEYCFEPGAEKDGVTLRVPLGALHQINAERCEWLVPGMQEDKILALIKGLPKRWRKNFVPAPDFAHAAMQSIETNKGSLISALDKILRRMTGVVVPADEWPKALEPHLTMRFEVFDSQRKTLASGRNIVKLEAALADTLQKLPKKKSTKSFERSHITDWDFGELPEFIDQDEGGYSVKSYPALSVSKNGISLKLFNTKEIAQQAMTSGLRELLRSKLKHQIRYLDNNLPEMQKNCLRFTTIGTCQTLKDDLISASIQSAFLSGDPQIRSAEDFKQLLENHESELLPIATTIAAALEPILEPAIKIRKQLKGNLPLNRIEAAADIKTQLEALVFPGFLLVTPFERLADIPRYLHAIEKRLQKLDIEPDKDRHRRVEIEPLQKIFSDLTEGQSTSAAAIEFRWLLEELRVSLFAQELGVKGKVSPKRLDKLAKSYFR